MKNTKTIQNAVKTLTNVECFYEQSFFGDLHCAFVLNLIGKVGMCKMTTNGSI